MGFQIRDKGTPYTGPAYTGNNPRTIKPGIATQSFNGGGVQHQDGVAESQNTNLVPSSLNRGGMDPSTALAMAAMNQKNEPNPALAAALQAALANQNKRSEEPKTPAQQVDSKMAEMVKKLDEKIGDLEKSLELYKGQEDFDNFFKKVKEIQGNFKNGNYTLDEKARKDLTDKADAAKALPDPKSHEYKQINSIVGKIETQADLADLRKSADGVMIKETKDGDNREVKLSETQAFANYVTLVANRANGEDVKQEDITKAQHDLFQKAYSNGAGDGDVTPLVDKVNSISESLNKIELEPPKPKIDEPTEPPIV